ncbi:MAG: hypothetical protein ACREA9_24160 [Pyrinomonadaceae bacterium]
MTFLSVVPRDLLVLGAARDAFNPVARARNFRLKVLPENQKKLLRSTRRSLDLQFE